MRLLDEAALDESIGKDDKKLPYVLMAENVKALRPYLPIIEKEYAKRGYKMYYTLFNSKWWGVPQNRERYFVIGIRDTLSSVFTFPTEQHGYVPKLSTILEKNVDEKYYIDDEKAQSIIKQALQKLESLGNCHATITPDRVNKRQNGRRAKEDEAESFTLTAQDIHGVIVDDTCGYDGVRPYTDTTPTLRSSRQGVKVVEKDLVPDGETSASALIHSRGLETRKDGISHCLKGAEGGSSKNFIVEKITEVCVNDRGFKDRSPQVSEVVPTLRAENHGNHPKIVQLAHKGSGGQKGYIHSTDGIVGACTATDYKDPKLVLVSDDIPKLEVVGMLENSGTTQQHNNRVYDTEGVSPTVTAVAGGTHHIKVFDPSRYRVRKLTPTEYGRLQGFPMDNWEQVVSNSQAYKQFGNAVTVNVSEAIATTVARFLGKVGIM